MHRLSASFILGYHGCDQAVAEKLLAGDSFEKSQNDYDWLGSGIYFWEANPKRGLDFPEQAMKRPGSKIKVPAVIGAVVDLGNCLDLMSAVGIDMVRAAYDSLSLRLLTQLARHYRKIVIVSAGNLIAPSSSTLNSDSHISIK